MEFIVLNVLNGFTLICCSVIGIFTVRRFIFLLTALFHRVDWRIHKPGHFFPTVTILIPCYNEESVIRGTLEAIAKLSYPQEKLDVVVADDASNDKTLTIVRNISKSYSNIHIFHKKSGTRKGKASILNEALSCFGNGEIVYFIDADHHLRPDALIRLVRHFTDPGVGAVSGRCIPWNNTDSLISGYVYLESLVHHRITMYASDILKLAPAILGSNFCIRRSVLEALHFFDEETLTEDIDLTVRLYEHGYIVRYDVTSISEHEAPSKSESYVKQHIRWNRGYNTTARRSWRRIITQDHIPVLRRIEIVFLSLGYIDRLFVLVAAGLTCLSLFLSSFFRFPFWVWIPFLGIPALEILTGVLIDSSGGIRMALRLPFILPVFFLDIWIALKANLQDITKKPARWHKTARIGDGSGEVYRNSEGGYDSK